MCVISCAATAGLLNDAAAQDVSFPKASAEDLGLRLPNAPPKPAAGRRVITAKSIGEPVVAKVVLEVGDRFAVLLPNGRLIDVAQGDAPLTERPFKPFGKAEIVKELKEKFPEFKTASTVRYVYAYNTSKPFYEATSRILETMHPALVAYCKRQRLKVQPLQTPLIVVMFRTEKEFQEYREMPAGVTAYYNTVNNYIVMYEQSSLTEVAPTIAIKQSISTIAHEGVHQILHNIGVQHRLSEWPMWISEGLPEFFSPTSVDRRVRWNGVGKPKHMRMKSLRELAQTRGDAIANGQFVSRIVAARALNASGYAASWAMTDFLAKRRREEFFAFIREVSELGPLQEPPDQVALFEKHFGNDYEKLQKELFNHLGKLPYVDPVLNQPHFVGVLDIGVLRSIVVTSSPASLRDWRDEVLSQAPAAARASARLNVRVFPNKALADRAAQTAQM
ncbi:MAG: DUF1570 domain-containing protein [Pirellulaceae bacterium]|nr:DUF1570 domain-containing protein [Pirellulaceae bacterium]